MGLHKVVCPSPKNGCENSQRPAQFFFTGFCCLSRKRENQTARGNERTASRGTLGGLKATVSLDGEEGFGGPTQMRPLVPIPRQSSGSHPGS